MQVETYEIEEIKGEMGVMAADSESLELIQKLGLTGQMNFANGETVTRFPYPKMSPLQHKVFSLLFPEHDEISKYDGGIIPLRVLQVAAYVKENPPAKFNKICVWHTGVAKEDPILVGHSAEWGGEFYLLARWGDALDSFEKLCEKAKKVWRIRAEALCKKEISEWQSDTAQIDAMANELFTTGKVTIGNNSHSFSSL